MCGIVGYIGTQPATNLLLEGLRRLEYRGYDSAGIATVWEGKIASVRAPGKLHNLQEKLRGIESPARLGIGHTRWATHGKPEERNAHPQLDGGDRVAVVQNGIIENYRELKETLAAAGCEFRSDTDTEVVPQLIARHLAELDQQAQATGQEPASRFPSRLIEAVRRAIGELTGAFALAIVAADYPDELIVVRQQAPLAIGFGQGEFFCASDTPALIPHTRAVLSLDNGELARLTPLGVEIFSFDGQRVVKYPHTLDWNPAAVEKQGFRHFMLKEIFEQPEVVRAFVETYCSADTRDWSGEGDRPSPVSMGVPPALTDGVEHIQILACGTSLHAGWVGKYLLEELAGIPTTVNYASEFRYFPTPPVDRMLTIGVTQSGETTDTLAALEAEQTQRAGLGPELRARLVGITNRPENTISRVVDHIIAAHAGIEISVAATKSFTTQLLAFYGLAIELGARRGKLSRDRVQELVAELRQLPTKIERVLANQNSHIEQLAHEFSQTQDFIFLGRGVNFPIALEGALKLKEISYIHAEGYPAGEMKHGPIALLDDKVPVLTIAVPGPVYEKVISNAQEAKARDVRSIGVVVEGDRAAAELFDVVLEIPEVSELFSPLLTVVPLQLLSYHIAARRGLDVDQPRNLAKSVTVE